MFRALRIPVILFNVIIYFSAGTEGLAQVQENEIPALKQKAMEYFEAGSYTEAEPFFSSLVRQFPMDPIYRYYSGICKVESNRDLESAAEMLLYASSRGVPGDVFYFLGEAHRKLYDFEKARKYFIEFDREAPRSMARRFNSKLLVNSMVSAQQLTSMYNPYNILNVTFINLSDPEQFEQIKMKGGTLVRKPEEFFSSEEDREDLNSLMFMPVVSERGKKVYFSGYTGSRKNGFQIMESRKNTAGRWTEPVPVEALNSEGDEILPYFDPVENDMYFASNGREGLGGFDLFRAHYDEENDQWSEPINMGFPVNSAFDDYLLLPGSDLGMVIIFTARQTTDSLMTVYRVHLSEPKKSLNSGSPQEIRRIANFGNIAQEVLPEYEEAKKDESKGAIQKKDPSPDAIEKSAVKSKIPPADPGQQQLIASALRHQAVSDSLTELVSVARIRVRESDDPNDRWLYQKQIIVWEKKAREEQELADAGFAGLTGNENPAAGEIVEIDTVINDITVYRYSNKDSVTGMARNAFQPGKQPVVTDSLAAKPEGQEFHVPEGENDNIPAAGREAKVESKEVVHHHFEIRDSSPYNENNPIPVDDPLPEGTCYRIQLGVFSKIVDSNAFGGLYPVFGETIPGKGLTRYYAGSFSTFAGCQDALQKVREKGYNDAFIVSWYNGGKISVEKARKLEK